MRIFAALVPPLDVLDDIEDVVSPLRKDDRLRWSRQDMWHVTTAFYGNVDESQLHDLRMELEHVAARSNVSELRLENATEFNGKTLVLEVAGDLDGLSELARRCTTAGRTVGLSLEHRRYRPHLTIGRSSRSRDLSELVGRLIGTRTKSWQPHELVVFNSITGARPRYEPITHWPLA